MKAIASTALLLLPLAVAVHAQETMHMDHGAHAGHQHPGVAPAAPPLPSPFPAPTAEQRAAAFPPLDGMDMRQHMQDDPLIATLRFDRLEYAHGGDLDWNARASIGHDFDKLLLRSEGGKEKDASTQGDAEILWSHATGPWWDRVVGLRHDFGDGPSRQWLALGVAGLAPYRFELEATAYLGEGGRWAAKLEGDYEILLSNRLILQPRLEANAYGKDDPRNGIGSGLSDAEFGLRLRYEFSPRFAPYVGYVWSRRYGTTADLAEAAGRERSDDRWVAGLRFWF